MCTVLDCALKRVCIKWCTIIFKRTTQSGVLGLGEKRICKSDGSQK